MLHLAPMVGYIDPKTGQVLVPGLTAAPGFDVASGWGTVNASTLSGAHRRYPGVWPGSFGL